MYAPKILFFMSYWLYKPFISWRVWVGCYIRSGTIVCDASTLRSCLRRLLDISLPFPTYLRHKNIQDNIHFHRWKISQSEQWTTDGRKEPLVAYRLGMRSSLNKACHTFYISIKASISHRNCPNSINLVRAGSPSEYQALASTSRYLPMRPLGVLWFYNGYREWCGKTRDWRMWMYMICLICEWAEHSKGKIKSMHHKKSETKVKTIQLIKKKLTYHWECYQEMKSSLNITFTMITWFCVQHSIACKVFKMKSYLDPLIKLEH